MRIINILIVLICCGCAQGTGTGNPLHAGGPSDGLPLNTNSEKILLAACAKIVSCHSLGSDENITCQSFAYQQTTFADALGLNIAPPPKAVEISNMERNGTLIADIAAATNCENQIKALACGDANVQNGYVSGQPDPYAAAADLLSDDCKDVFGP